RLRRAACCRDEGRAARRASQPPAGDVRMTGRPSRLLDAFAVAIYAFLFAPIVVLIVSSFNDSRRTFVWKGFTLDGYPRLFANDDLLDALFIPLQVAAVAVVV